MTITFKSEGSASVQMKEKNAQELLALLGKIPSEARGVFTLEQLGGAIGILRNLINTHENQRRVQASTDSDEGTGDVFEVDISLRAMPLLELFELAQKKQKPVTWGI